MFDVDAFHASFKPNRHPPMVRKHTPNLLGVNCWNADGTWNQAKADKVCRERIKRAPPGFDPSINGGRDQLDDYAWSVLARRHFVKAGCTISLDREREPGKIVARRSDGMTEVIDLHPDYAPTVQVQHLPRGWVWGDDGIKIPAPECAAKPAGKRGRPRKAPAPTRAPESAPASPPDALASDPLDAHEADLRALMAQWLDAGEPAPRAPDPAPVKLAPWSPALCEHVLAASLARVLGAGHV
jgi:hypothetical protein